MLFVYDSTVVPCPMLHMPTFKPLMQEVEEGVGIRVHAVVLSVDEAGESRFVEQVDPIELRSTRACDA